jgi:translocation and assembly module TamB
MTWKRRIGWTAVVIVALIAVSGVGAYWYLQSSAFQRYATARIIQQTKESTGARLEVQHLDLKLRTLTSDLYGLTIHGTEGVGQPPLLQADELTVRLRIDSVLRRKITLQELLIVHPVAHVAIDENGKTNFPEPPPTSKPSSSTNVFDLAVRHALLSAGEIYLNDRKTPFAADVRDLKIETHYEFPKSAYVGSIEYGNADLQYGHYAPVSHALNVKFTATPAALNIDPLSLRVASSTVLLRTKVENFAQPKVDGTYEVHVHGQDLAQLSSSVKVEGDMAIAGPIKYDCVSGMPLLRCLDISGHLSSDGLSAKSAAGNVIVRRLVANYRIATEQVQSNDIVADLLDGRAWGTILIRNLDTTPNGTASVKIQGISLDAMKRTFTNEQLKRLPVTGSLGGETRATWVGSLQNVRLSSDLSLRGAIWDQANPPSPRFPLDGVAHVSYDGRRNSLLVSQTSLRAASVFLNFQGELGDHSNLQVGAVAPDLHEASQLISLLQQSESPAPQKVDVSGVATLKAIVLGPIRRPSISGNLDAENVEAQGSRWKTVKASFDLDPSRLVVKDISLIDAHQGDASGNVQISLTNWSYAQANPIAANLSVHRMAITDLQHLAGVDYPIAGNLAANVAVSGSQLHPTGKGQLQITDGKAYGEPFNALNARFDAADGTIRSTIDARLPAGEAHGEGKYVPASKSYTFQASAPNIVLEKLASVKQKNLEIAGTVRAFARGEGTVDNPQMTATVELPKLQLQQTAITEMKADLNVANQRANLALVSDVNQAHISGHGYVNLTPDRYADFTVDTNKVPLQPFLVLYAPSLPEGFQGETELHATLKGPLQDRSKVEAHVMIATLRAQYQNLELASTAPIHADYRNSELTLQPAELTGTGTSITWRGSIGTSAMDIAAKGSIDARILKLVQPDMNSGGSVSFDLRTSGTVHSPQVDGRVHLQDVAVVTPDAPLGVEKLNGDIELNSEKAELRNITGQVGGGQVSLGGTVEFRPAVQFNVVANGDGVRLRYPAGVRTVLDSKLILNGTPSESTLTGRVLIDSLSFTPEFDLSSFVSQFEGTAPPPTGESFADRVKLAITVQSSQNLSATSAQVSLEGAANLRVIGTATQPVIVGRADLTSGELFFRNNRYQLQRGLITFNNPAQTAPFLNVAATTTIQQYNLTITMNGPIDKLSTSYVSDPPLATADVINLMASGQTTQQASANSSTDSILAGQVASQFSGNIQKFAGLSSLEIDPLIGGNNQNPSARIAVQQRITRNLLFTFSTDVSQPGNEIVQGDYQINRRWSVSVARDELGGISVDGRYHTKF